MQRLRSLVSTWFGRGNNRRFLIAGAINTAFGLAIYPLLLFSSIDLRRHYFVALLIAQAISLVFAFCVHKLFVFRSDGRIIREFFTFASFYLSIYAINWLTLPLLVELAGIAPVAAQTGFSIIVVVGSYFFHHKVTFAAPIPDVKTG